MTEATPVFAPTNVTRIHVLDTKKATYATYPTLEEL